MGLPRTTGPMPSSVPPGSGGMVSGAGPAGPGFLGSQPQTVLMKQMLIDQRAQLMEQQKQQFLREQRQQQQQQQQQQILTEQVTHAYGGLNSQTFLQGLVSERVSGLVLQQESHWPALPKTTEEPAECRPFH